MDRKTHKDISTEQLLRLYQSVGWTHYTQDPEALTQAVANSTYVVSLWDGESLIGLARCLSDDASIFYLQDILLRPEQQGKGYGKLLLKDCLERFEHVRQRVLLTDDRVEQKALYGSLGFHNVAELKKHRLNAYVQFRGLELE